MDYHCKNALFFAFSVVICLQFVAIDANPFLIDAICLKTMKPSFCSQQLRSDSRSIGANYTTLARILLDRVESRVASMKDVIRVILRQNLPVNQQLRLATCLDGCNEAIVDASWCKYALKLGSGDFKGLKSQAFSLLNHFKKCDNLFEESPAEPLKIKEASGKIQELCNAILVISKLGILEHPFDVCSGFNC
nr:pectinesterase inhibitor-like [Ipomoea batatas]GME20055.1 pectinesterase inhibitor-like [Ipomoea batatas]